VIIAHSGRDWRERKGMINIEQLSKQLTLDEFNAGRDLFDRARDCGNSAHKSAGMVYRAGYMAAKKETRERYGNELNRLHGIIKEMRNSQPEATENTEAIEAKAESSEAIEKEGEQVNE
jgi:hypothetical protein